jgi:hypothetical protein
MLRKNGGGYVNVEFILGEQKYVDFNIKSRTDESFVIISASYQFKNGSEVLDSGPCEIDGSIVSVLLAPQSRGRFVLEIAYTIPPETRKAKVFINVS